MKLSRASLLAAALLLFAAPLQAQPYGLIPEENPQNRPDLYTMRVRQEVTRLLGTWKRAWDADNARAAADLYTRDGTFVGLSGEETRTRDSLRVELEEVFGGAGSLRFSIQDFDLSGEMVYVRGEMAYPDESASAAGAAQVHAFILIARRQRNDVWLIRALTLVPFPAAPAAAPPAPAAPAAPGAPPGT